MSRRRLALVLLAVLLPGAFALARLAEPWRGMPEPPQVDYPDFDYDGRFTFARIRFRPTVWDFGQYTWGLDLKWNHDYPQAEQNFMKIIDDLTEIEPRVEHGNVLEIDDPRLFDHPWAYMCEPGFWSPTEEQARILREYVLKGGFLIIDDFFDPPGRTAQWNNFESQIQRVFPGVVLYPMHLDHPIFRAFFDLEDLDFTMEDLPFYSPVIYGIFEDNDPEKRLMVVVNYNMDVGDYWEWSDTDYYPQDMTQKGFKLGINYLLYGLLH